MGPASQVKSLLQELLDPNGFLGFARSSLVTRSFGPQLPPKAVLRVP